MSQNASPPARSIPRAYAQSRRFDRDAFSVFLILAASVAAAALLYSQGA
jgi:hypothetical protein